MIYSLLAIQILSTKQNVYSEMKEKTSVLSLCPLWLFFQIFENFAGSIEAGAAGEAVAGMGAGTA
jgi:hypothetical protein